MLQLASILFGVFLNANAAFPAAPVALQDLEPTGIHFLVDTKENMGYIINDKGQYALIKVATGQNKVVHYLGQTYNALTPSEHWTAKTFHTQSDRITFGPKGKFLRLYRDGTEYTAYGIHSYAYIKDFLKEDDRYRSMGCVLVDDDVMEYLVDAFKKNGNKLEVVTVHGLDTVAAK